MNKIRKHDISISLSVGNISLDRKLNGYYQDFSPAIVHFPNNFSCFGDDGLPHCESNGKKIHSTIHIIQYGLICHELFINKIDKDNNERIVKTCLDWLDNKKEIFKDSYVFRSSVNKQYALLDGWVSGMYQGQAISLYLRGYQLFNNMEYLETANKIFNSFKYDYVEGGFKRFDENNCLWFEEYPTSKPSYVLNGFIYSIFGILDFYRVTESQEAKELWEECVRTLEVNLNKYDVWYWSVYDQLKEQLVSSYYQKNVHIPLMQILYDLTEKEIFNKYAIKWKKNFNNPFHRLITQIMYRVQPRILYLKKALANE